MTSIMALSAAALMAFADPAREEGNFEFTPSMGENSIPEMYRLQGRKHWFQLDPPRRPEESHTTQALRFDSPVASPFPENNTVHAVYYRPVGRGPFPTTVVLDITGGDQSLSRLISTYLARNGVGALFMQMAYYGPRRPPGTSMKLMSANLLRTLPGIRQTVLDIRVARAWLASRPEVDKARIGVSGTSLGSLFAALAGSLEPRFDRVVILLGGGGMVEGFHDHPQARPVFRELAQYGLGKETIAFLLAPYDPATWAGRLKGRKVLMLEASRDEIISPAMATCLWKAAGQPEIVWFDCTHYGAIAYLGEALRRMRDHLKS
ncbi:MAG: alpha/beta hydrolase family protein [Planctomycetota bacterium]